MKLSLSFMKLSLPTMCAKIKVSEPALSLRYVWYLVGEQWPKLLQTVSRVTILLLQHPYTTRKLSEVLLDVRSC